MRPHWDFGLPQTKCGDAHTLAPRPPKSAHRKSSAVCPGLLRAPRGEVGEEGSVSSTLWASRPLRALWCEAERARCVRSPELVGLTGGLLSCRLPGMKSCHETLGALGPPGGCRCRCRCLRMSRIFQLGPLCSVTIYKLDSQGMHEQRTLAAPTLATTCVTTTCVFKTWQPILHIPCVTRKLRDLSPSCPPLKQVSALCLRPGLGLCTAGVTHSHGWWSLVSVCC